LIFEFELNIAFGCQNTMKNKFLALFLGCTSLLFAQEETNERTKFQVGLHYVGNIRNNNIISDGFNGIIGISGSYAVYQNEKAAISGGLTVDYLQSRDLFLPNDILIWNPNAAIEVNIFNGKVRPFLGIGYAFFSNDLKFATGVFDPMDPAITVREKKLNFNGLTINPGLKYHVSDLLFLEGSYKYFPVNSSDFEGSANTHFISFGLGIKF
jgi:opacity protein-like surface antigen